ncbi:MAG: MBL fold metallo-hydrolase, partial [Porticoccaceae bacterium]|nr:MBL fold metallo-hydrolase [Porticoccaceae bacterium]
IVFFSFTAQSCSVAENFNNSDPMASPKSFKEFLKWRWTKDSPPQPEAIEVSDQWRDLPAKASHYSVWIGHATFLINNGDLTIVTDPIFSQRASPVGWAGPKRLIPPSIPLVELPQIDVVLISHNHYDHLDIPSLLALQEINPDLIILVPQGDKALLERAGLRKVTERRWWQNLRVSETDFTFTPVQHWSARALSGRNSSWWGGWFMKHPKLALYHAGDTGYSEDFVETRERLGVPDFAFIPIGAYSPRWFMKNQHVDPAEAVQIALDLQVPKSFGMHWGTFILTDEPIKEPREKLAEVLLEQGLQDDFFIAPVPGEIIWLQ